MLFGFHFDMHVLYYPDCTSSALLTELTQMRSQHPSAWAAWQNWSSHSVQQANVSRTLKSRALTAQLFPEFPLALCIVKSDLCYTSADQLTLHKHLSSVSDICFQTEIKYLSKSIINIQDTTLAIRSLLKLINPDSLYGKFPRPKIIWLIVLWHSIYMMKY